MNGRPRVGLLFGDAWDADGFAALGDRVRIDHAGFDLFSFPSNAHLIHFDLLRFAHRQARRGQRLGWAYQNSAQRTSALASWQHHYNCHRPHSGIGGVPPLSRLLPLGNNVLTLHS